MVTIEQVIALADAVEHYRQYSRYESLRKPHALALVEAFRGSSIFVNDNVTHAFERYWQWSMLAVETEEERGYLEQLKAIAADRFACLLLAYLGRNEPTEVPEAIEPTSAYESESPPPPSSAPATPSDGELPL
jgi:hypothetical protein